MEKQTPFEEKRLKERQAEEKYANDETIKNQAEGVEGEGEHDDPGKECALKEAKKEEQRFQVEIERSKSSAEKTRQNKDKNESRKGAESWGQLLRPDRIMGSKTQV